MSSILDALNKLEEEQAQAEVDSTELDVAPEVAEKDLVSPSVIRDRMTFRLSPALLALGGGVFVVALVTISVAVSLVFLRRVEPVTQLAAAPPVSAAVQTSPEPETVQTPPQRSEANGVSPTGQASEETPNAPATAESAATVKRQNQESAPAIVSGPADARAAIEKAGIPAVPPVRETLPVPSGEAEAPAFRPAITQSAQPLETSPIPEPVTQSPAQNLEPENTAPAQPRSSTSPKLESPPAKVSAGWNETRPAPAENGLQRSASTAPQFTRPSASTFGTESFAPTRSAIAPRRTFSDAPVESSPRDSFDSQNLPPLLSAGVRARYGIGRIKINLLREKSDTNPYASATINRIRIHEGDPIQGTGTNLVRILRKGAIIEIVTTGDIYFLPR